MLGGAGSCWGGGGGAGSPITPSPSCPLQVPSSCSTCCSSSSWASLCSSWSWRLDSACARAASASGGASVPAWPALGWPAAWYGSGGRGGGVLEAGVGVPGTAGLSGHPRWMCRWGGLMVLLGGPRAAPQDAHCGEGCIRGHLRGAWGSQGTTETPAAGSWLTCPHRCACLWRCTTTSSSPGASSTSPAPSSTPCPGRAVPALAPIAQVGVPRDLQDGGGGGVRAPQPCHDLLCPPARA